MPLPPAEPVPFASGPAPPAAPWKAQVPRITVTSRQWSSSGIFGGGSEASHFLSSSWDSGACAGSVTAI